MLVELTFRALNPTEVPDLARRAEIAGFDGITVNETSRDSFVAAAAAITATDRIRVATAVTIAFPRSPTVTAMAAWDLQQLSGGRFGLGLGSQVKGHIERRFGIAWGPAAPRLREYVGAVRALWNSFQNGLTIDYRGVHYRLTLLTREFNPGPIAWPEIPIGLAGLNAGMCSLAGEVADAFRTHPIMTPLYIRDIALPALRAGAAKAGREAPAVLATSFQALGDSDEELSAARTEARRTLSFYASTPAYRRVLAVHGLEDLGEKLTRLAAEGKWAEMPAMVDDSVLDTFVLSGQTQDLPRLVFERFGNLAAGYAVGPLPPAVLADADRLGDLVAGFRAYAQVGR